MYNSWSLQKINNAWKSLTIVQKKKWILPEKIKINNNLFSQTDLDLSYQSLYTIPNIISVLSNLKSLNLQGNFLRSIPLNFFDNLQNLELLNLKGKLFIFNSLPMSSQGKWY
jgi:Leucine-rich repeat (LRR) protein